MLKNVKLKELGEIFTGSTPSKKNKEFYNSEDIMFIKPDILAFDIVNIGVSNEYISEKAREKARILPANSLLVSCIGSIGKLGINEKEVAFNQQINAIVPNNKIKSSRYLAYLLKYNQKKLESIANAPVVPIINKTQFSEFEVLIHENLNFQEQITQILDKSKEIIEKRKEQIQFLDKLVKSKFIEMFGELKTNKNKFRIVELESLTTKITDGVHSKPEYMPEGVEFISVKDINKGNLDFSECKYISREAHESYIKRCKPEKGDILYTKVGATYGIPAIVDTDKEFSLYVSVALIKLKKGIVNPIYIKEALRSVDVKRQADRQVKGIGVPDLHLVEIKKFNIFNPPIELQNQFADFIKQVDKLKFEMERISNLDRKIKNTEGKVKKLLFNMNIM
ncbi:restriction endonuclease subunit S [Clostridium perfringens]|uniref:restriction endonuclease subunit S n=1 Tax=Clostridium perfringens TaxID=1502 RepID=UPI0013E3DB90|nr:restriction endonuclease subunit S [Clostridium perfringens]NGU54053.1 restriction endonuclease subunit S [Clostridium perfringens]